MHYERGRTPSFPFLCEASAFCGASAVEYYYVYDPVGFGSEQRAFNIALVALRQEALAMLKLLLL
jgi:hypothetical protein